ncbi:MAG: hydantoinase B/oxoprolinase family protein, partial [Alphaproteobacteria bacterium]
RKAAEGGHFSGTRPPPPPPALAGVGTSPVNRGGKSTIYERAKLAPDAEILGPAIIVEANATTVIEPEWRARIDVLGNLILERTGERAQRFAAGTKADPVMLEVFNNLFMAIAEQMGVALQNTASSVNIKERLDFSCALFTQDGALIANAPHIPVHLGSMGESIKTIIAARGAARDGRGIKPGDAYILNAPYAGGTHLPDITAIMPVFVGGDLTFFTAARGHHADIGGITPGSMPPNSTSILEEGVLFDNFLLVDQHEFRQDALLAALRAGRYPARQPEQNVADLKAQVAACTRGAHELLKLCNQFGRDVVLAYMEHVQANAAECVRRAIDKLQDGAQRIEMDNGAVINVAVAIDKAARRARVDFTGTSAQATNNFNAPSSIARAAVLYVFRTLVDDDIPMNEGCLAPIDIVLPPHSLLSPDFPAAVVAGNVETSQAITDALFGALGTMAAAQGTMNNFTFGDDEHQYYETICGGAGAGPDFDGASAVQTHMTNSRLTDPEVIEWRFPVLIEEFSIHRGSGGAGAHRGGDGVTRRVKFLKPMTAGILSNRRRIAPFGLNGGGAGARGANFIVHADGETQELGATAEVAMNAGDTFVIETPGGGGFGRK